MNEQQINEALKEISDLRNVKVGDMVWTVQEGWTKTLDITLEEEYIFGTTDNRYDLNGLYVKGDNTPSCFTKNPFTYILEKFSNQERIIEVNPIGKSWVKRRLVTLMPNGNALCYTTTTDGNLDSTEKSNYVNIWSKDSWREVEPIPTFTKEEICKLLNVEDFIINE